MVFIQTNLPLYRAVLTTLPVIARPRPIFPRVVNIRDAIAVILKQIKRRLTDHRWVQVILGRLDSSRVYINYVISQYDIDRRFVDLAISQRPDIVWYRARMHVSRKQCRMVIIISGTVKWKARLYSQGAAASSNTRTLWSVLHPLNILHIQADDGSGGGEASWEASTAMPCPCLRRVG